MTKVTREETLAGLRRLKVGDKLIGGPGSPWFTEGKDYEVYDDAGDLYVMDNDGDEEYINVGYDYQENVYSRIMSGVLNFAQSVAPFYVFIESTDLEYDSGLAVLSIEVDATGLERLEALVAESERSIKLPQLLKQKADIEANIAAIMKGDN